MNGNSSPGRLYVSEAADTASVDRSTVYAPLPGGGSVTTSISSSVAFEIPDTAIPTQETMYYARSDHDLEDNADSRECGVGAFRPLFLQGSCASIKSFTFFCSALVTVQVREKLVTGVLTGK